MADDNGKSGQIGLPRRRASPVAQFGRRILYATLVLMIMFVIVLLDRGGYRDQANDSPITVIDALYYTTVSLSTTGYGDIVPVTQGARLITALVITPLRVMFLAILVGTAFEVLTRRTRDEYRIHRWRSKLQGHIVVIGYGTKGRSAIETLSASGHTRDEFLVVDRRADHIAEANADGIAGVVGDGTRATVLRSAKVDRARYVVIAPDRDDTAVLTTLTARQLAPDAVIVASVRESENEPLLLRSGATAVVTSSAAAGRLLGFAALSPGISHVFSDLLVHGAGLEIVERAVTAEEAGRAGADGRDQIIAVVRDGAVRPVDAGVTLSPDDRVICVRSGPGAPVA